MRYHIVRRTTGTTTSAPEWFTSLPEKTWDVIAAGPGYGEPYQNGATLLSQDPQLPQVYGAPCDSLTGQEGHKALITNWTGFLANQEDGALGSLASAGHGGGWDNGYYELGLRQPVPSWRRLVDPTPAAYAFGSWLCQQTPAQYADGRPAACHNVNETMHANGRAWMVAQTAPAAIGFGGPASVWSLDRRSLTGPFPIPHDGGVGPWTYHGTPAVARSNGFGAGCYDPIGRKLWAFSTQELPGFYYSIDDTSAAFQTYVQPSTGFVQHWGSQWAVCVPDLRLIVLSDFNSSMVWILDLTNPSAGLQPKTTSGRSGGEVGFGAVYHHPSSSILSFSAANGFYTGLPNGNIQKLKVPRNGDGTYNSGVPWTQTTVTKAGGASPTFEFNDAAGTNGKFNMIADMGNGQSCLVVCSGYSPGFTYAYKLPMGELN